MAAYASYTENLERHKDC